MAFKEKMEKANSLLLNVPDWLQDLPFEEIQKINIANKFNYSIAVLNLHGDRNAGMIARTGVVFSAKRMFVFGRKKFDARTCVGADKYIDVLYIANSFKNSDPESEEICPEKFKKTMEENNLIPFFIEQGGTDIRKINWKVVENSIPEGKQICFVFGNEGIGISLPILQQHKYFSSEIISIPQTGAAMRSLNVSCAATILLWEFAKSKMN